MFQEKINFGLNKLVSNFWVEIVGQKILVKRMLVKRNIWSKIILVKIISGQKKNCQQIIVLEQFWSKKEFCQRKFLVKK